MKLSLLLILIINFSGCTSRGKFEVNNVARDSVLKIATKASNPSMLNLIIQGYADDSFMVNHIFLKGGPLNDTLQFDWYNDTIIVAYKSYKAKKGRLNFTYKL